MAGLATYKRTIAAGRRETIGARGVAIIVRDVVGEIEITARSSNVGDGGGQAYSNIMRKFEKWFLPQEFDSVEVMNNQETAVEVELLIGYGDYVREVTSRTQAAKFLRGARKTVTLAEGTGFTQLLPENLQRKRALFTCISSAAATRLYVTPAPAGDPLSSAAFVGDATDNGGGSWVFNTSAGAFTVEDIGSFGVSMEFDGDETYTLTLWAVDEMTTADLLEAESFIKGIYFQYGDKVFELEGASRTVDAENSQIFYARTGGVAEEYFEFDYTEQSATPVGFGGVGHGVALRLDGEPVPVEATAAIYVKHVVGEEEAAASLVVDVLEEEFDA